MKGSTSCIDQALRYAPLGSGPSHHSQSCMAPQTLACANSSAFPLSFHATCNNRKLGEDHKLFPWRPQDIVSSSSINRKVAKMDKSGVEWGKKTNEKQSEGSAYIAISQMSCEYSLNGAHVAQQLSISCYVFQSGFKDFQVTSFSFCPWRFSVTLVILMKQGSSKHTCSSCHSGHSISVQT